MSPTAPPSRRAVLGDVALALLFAAVVVLETHAAPAGDGEGSSLWLGLVTVVPVAFRRTSPAGSLAAAALLVLGPSLLVSPFHPWFYGNEVTLYVLVYSFARRSGSVAARWAWLAGPLVFLAQAVGAPETGDVSDLLFDGVVLGAAWLAGRTVRRFDEQGRELRATLAQLAEEQRVREASAVSAERTRIAAEMHDVVAHAVSLMVVQVGATRIRLERDGRPRDGLAAVEDAGREALDELRRMLGVLREPSVETTAPLPGGSALPELVAEYAGLGLVVELAADPLDDLPDGTGLTVYRIVQDALENALTHGAEHTVTASVRRRDGQVLIDVANPVAAHHDGHEGPDTVDRAGPRRIRERVALFRGSLGADRHDDSWQVHVVLPVDDLTTATS
jgi:signal transduction histidine kinase